jgi:predicted nucleic acid-binding protein
VQATETLVARADGLAWELGLRGYDAVHLASALSWQEGLGAEVTLATFDRRLWEAAGGRGLRPLPENLPALLEERQ